MPDKTHSSTEARSTSWVVPFMLVIVGGIAAALILAAQNRPITGGATDPPADAAPAGE